MLMLLRVEWLRCEFTCDQAVLLPILGKRTRAVLFSPFPEKKPDRGLGVNGFKTETKRKRIIAVYNQIPLSAFRNNRPTPFVIKKAGTFCFSKMLLSPRKIIVITSRPSRV